MRRLRNSRQVHIVKGTIATRFVTGGAAEATCSAVGF